MVRQPRSQPTLRLQERRELLTVSSPGGGLGIWCQIISATQSVSSSSTGTSGQGWEIVLLSDAHGSDFSRSCTELISDPQELERVDGDMLSDSLSPGRRRVTG